MFNAWVDNVTLVDGKVQAVSGVSCAFGGVLNTTAKTTIADMHTAGKTINLRGKNYDDVIVFIFSKDFVPVLFVCLQEGTGVLGY